MEYVGTRWSSYWGEWEHRLIFDPRRPPSSTSTEAVLATLELLATAQRCLVCRCVIDPLARVPGAYCLPCIRAGHTPLVYREEGKRQ